LDFFLIQIDLFTQGAYTLENISKKGCIDSLPACFIQYYVILCIVDAVDPEIDFSIPYDIFAIGFEEMVDLNASNIVNTRSGSLSNQKLLGILNLILFIHGLLHSKAQNLN